MKPLLKLAMCCVVLAFASGARADMFGTPGNEFTMDFVSVGDAGNEDDAGAGGGSYSSPYGGVPYTFGISTYEISQDMITKATASGLTNVTAGAWSASQPAANMTWYEAAAFVNWLNTSTGHQSAYNLTYSGGWSMSLWDPGVAWQPGGQNLYRHANAYYFLPSEDEWYKAAYHQNDGVTATYWDYPTGSNMVPDGIDSAGDTIFDAVFRDGYSQDGPNVVTNAGLPSAYGTMGQGGNVWEWMESAYDASNDLSSEVRGVRGGSWDSSESSLRPSGARFADVPSSEGFHLGFRVASVPEPSGALLLLLCGGAWILLRVRPNKRTQRVAPSD